VNKKYLVTSGIIFAGFAAGAILGFMWSTGVKSNISKSVTTKTEGGKFVVSVDIFDAVSGGVTDFLK